MKAATLTTGPEDHVMCMQALQQQTTIATLKRRLESAYDQYEQQQVCIGVKCLHCLLAGAMAAVQLCIQVVQCENSAMMDLLICMCKTGYTSNYRLMLLSVKTEYVIRAQNLLSDRRDGLNNEARHFSLVTGMYTHAGQLQEVCG